MLGKEGSCQLVDFIAGEVVPIWNQPMPALSASRPGFGAWSLRSLGLQGLVFAEALGRQGDGGGELAQAWEG